MFIISRRLSRKHVLFANTQFTAACYFPTGVQILTAGTDRSISYWECYDGSLVREKEGSKLGPVNCLDVNNTGEYFISSGTDMVVRLWNYELGEVIAHGHGHAGIVTACKFFPNGKFLVTGGADGAGGAGCADGPDGSAAAMPPGPRRHARRPARGPDGHPRDRRRRHTPR